MEEYLLEVLALVVIDKYLTGSRYYGINSNACCS
tara:strand:+ start:314 stop:415 length:102 start_codon:yes stop_codon:yes gene_type:complete